MLLLFVIGMLHAWLIWAGDILAPYALSGIIIMLFLYRTDKTIKVWIGIFVGGFLFLFSLLVGLTMWAMSMPEVAADVEIGFTEVSKEFQELLIRGYEVYSSGTYTEMIAYRSEEISFVWSGMFFTPMGIPYIIATFLFGFLIGRQGLLQKPKLLRSLLIPRRWKMLILGLLLSLVYATTYLYSDPVFFDGWTLLQMISIMLGAPLLMLGYCGFILHWLNKNRATSFLNRFAPVGRMALTNYILQSLICTSIFYGYGFGLIGRFPPVFILPLAAIIFLLQVYASEWYFKKYKMGPLEKLWRIGTYLKRV